MHNPLLPVDQRDVGYAELDDVPFQRLDLGTAFPIGNAGDPKLPSYRRHIMICDGKGEFRPAHLPPCLLEASKRLWTGYFVNEVPVDVEQPVIPAQRSDRMSIPNLVVEGSARAHECIICLGCPE